MRGMRKIKLYLDTSVVSHIDAPDRPDWEAVTKTFFRFVQEHSDEYVLLISPVVELELSNCPGPKRLRLAEFLAGLKYAMLPDNQDVLDLTRAYLDGDVLPAKHHRDLSHLAYAVVARCDYLVSWNMRHLVVARTISSAHAVNQANNYNSPFIVTPSIITGEQRHENG